MRLPAAVLLDLDGTLIDSESLHTEAIARFLRGHGIEMNEDERNFVIGHAWQEIHAFVRADARAGLDLSALMDGAHEARTQMHEEGVRLRVLPGARELADRLRELEIPTAIVSGSSRREIAMALPELGIAEQLAFYLGSDDYLRGKPAPDGYLMAANRLEVEAAHCLVFEDSEAGIESAIRAGMRVVATAAANPRPGTAGHQDHRRAHRRVDGLLGIDVDFLHEVMSGGGVD